MSKNKDNDKLAGIKESLEKNASVLKEKLTEYNEKLDHLPESIRNEYKEALKELDDKNNAIRSKLDEYRDTSESAFTDVQIGIEMAWDDLTIAFKSVKERLDKLTDK